MASGHIPQILIMSKKQPSPQQDVSDSETQPQHDLAPIVGNIEIGKALTEQEQPSIVTLKADASPSRQDVAIRVCCALLCHGRYAGNMSPQDLAVLRDRAYAIADAMMQEP